MDNPRVTAVEWGRLKGRRPRSAGRNARLGEHGPDVYPSLARVTVEDGSSGFGYCRASAAQAAELPGRRLDQLFEQEHGVLDPWLPFEYPLWDLVAKRSGRPVYELAADLTGRSITTPLHVPCYDTSLYIDDLHLADDEAAAELMAAEAREGLERGHRAFKVKVGRGARHMPLNAGTRRDILVTRAVRAAIGAEATLLVDANNGYNLNLAKQLLEETGDCHLYWLEEPFHEDPVLYLDLQAWLRAQGLPVLIADGEGEASPRLMEWSQEGLVNVVQYDIFNHGFSNWLATGTKLDSWHGYSAPHHYGSHYGNYASCHLAAAIHRFALVEWDEAQIPGLTAPGYAIHEGRVAVPATPGFGLVLDEEIFDRAVTEGGYRLTA